MAVKYTYSDTLTQIRSVLPEFDFLSPTELPFLKLISGGSEDQPSLSSLDAPCKASKYEWMEDIDSPVKTTLQGAINAAVTAMGVLVADALTIVPDMILQFGYLSGAEQVRVTAVSGGTDASALTVTRGWGATTAAVHADLDPVYIVGRAHVEGATAPEDSISYPTMPYNLAQEFAATVKISELEQAIARYGIENAVEFETKKKAREQFRMMERQCFFGKRVAAVGTTVPATFGGLDLYIPSGHVKDNSGGALATTDVAYVLQKIYEDVGTAGMPDTIICGPWVRRKLSTIYASTGVTTFRDQQERRGGVLVDTIQTELCNLDIVLTPWCDPTKMHILKIDKIGIGPVVGKEIKRQMLAKVGTSDNWMISGNYTLQVRASRCHGAISNISITT